MPSHEYNPDDVEREHDEVRRRVIKKIQSNTDPDVEIVVPTMEQHHAVAATMTMVIKVTSMLSDKELTKGQLYETVVFPIALASAMYLLHGDDEWELSNIRDTVPEEYLELFDALLENAHERFHEEN